MESIKNTKLKDITFFSGGEGDEGGWFLGVTYANFSIIPRAFPFLKKLKITEPFKSNHKNNKSIYSAIAKFLDMSEDDQSVYRQLLNSGQLSKEEVFHDTVFILFAGFDTTSHAICSTLYYLHKFPQTLSKLKDALDKDGITNIDTKKEDSLKDLYEQWDYLTYKEF